LLDYLSSRLERPVDLIQRSTYAEINELIRRGGADVAFVCGGAFVEGEREFGMQLLVVPQVGGQTTYYSYIIVAGDSPIQSLADLRGHSFAFTDPLSNSGHLSPLWLLNQMGESPETFFSQTTFTYSHDNSIRAVAEHVVDAAAVDSLVYDYVVARDPTYLERVRIIHRSAPYGIPPVVVHPQIDPALRAELLQVFLDMDDNDEGRAVLQDLRIERFIEGDPAMYESIRQMAITLRNWYVSP
jgi:phosphonate transport system substrate-binding protein